jgi:hypothetical protein
MGFKSKIKKRSFNYIIGGNMKLVKGICTKISTTKDQCIRITIDIDKMYAAQTDLLSWQDEMIEMECLEGMVVPEEVFNG